MQDSDTDTDVKSGWDKTQTLKLSFIFVVFVEAMALGMVPVKIKSFRENPKMLGIANAFSGGVFLAICLMHIMPEQSESWASLGEEGTISDKIKNFPVPYLLLVGGYTLILVIDRVLFDSHDLLEGEHGHGDGNANQSDDNNQRRQSIALRQSVVDMISQSQGGQNTDALIDDAIRKSMSKMVKKSDKFAARMSMSRKSQGAQIQDKTLTQSNVNEKDLSESDLDAKRPRGDSNLFVDRKEVDLARRKTEQNRLLEERQVVVQQTKKPACVEKMTPFILMIGLGVHATFEGLSLGIEKDFDKVMIFAIAIVLHKGAAGMSLGISMSQTFPGQDRFITTLLFIFALFTPLGVIIGWALRDSSELSEIVFSCLAAGSFLYISCSEVIVEEFSIPQFRFLKLFAYLIGIACISFLKILDPGDSSDEDGSDKSAISTCIDVCVGDAPTELQPFMGCVQDCQADEVSSTIQALIADEQAYQILL